jgi:hypothetical protein
MNFLIWRLHRNQVFFAGATLAVLTVLLLVTGSVMAHDYHVALANCAATQTCANLSSQLFRGDGAIMDVVDLTLVVPLLFGLFWGAPLLAKELEDGTHNLAWTQGVTRRHWLGSNVGWALLAATAWGACLAALVSWWRFPENALDTRFGAFDLQGIVPIAYSLFAVALGIAVGSVCRRVLPALATTLGIFVAIRVAIGVYLRPHYIPPVTKLFALLEGQPGAPAGSWIISSTIVGPGHHAPGYEFTLNDVPAACRSTFIGGKGISGTCMAAHGFHQLMTFQPANRFWAFQGIEASIFVVLAAALIGFAFWRVLSRDA